MQIIWIGLQTCEISILWLQSFRYIFSFSPNAKVWDDPLSLMVRVVWSVGGFGEGRQDKCFFIFLYPECSLLWTPFYMGELWHCLLIPANPVPKAGCESHQLSSSLGLGNAFSLKLALTVCWPVWIPVLNQCLASENSTLSCIHVCV